jgi:hypothetical protein
MVSIHLLYQSCAALQLPSTGLHGAAATLQHLHSDQNRARERAAGAADDAADGPADYKATCQQQSRPTPLQQM